MQRYVFVPIYDDRKRPIENKEGDPKGVISDSSVTQKVPFLVVPLHFSMSYRHTLPDDTSCTAETIS